MEFKQLSLALIEEGDLLRDFDDEFYRIQNRLMLHVQKHGDKSLKAKATINLKIELSVTNPDDGITVSIQGKVSSKLPDRPVTPTIAVGDETSEGKPTLACRTFGTSYDSPKQATLNSYGKTLSDEVIEEKD